MLDLQHQYNNCTTIPHMRVVLHTGAHPHVRGCCTVVILVLYKNQILYIYIKENAILTPKLPQHFFHNLMWNFYVRIFFSLLKWKLSRSSLLSLFSISFFFFSLPVGNCKRRRWRREPELDEIRPNPGRSGRDLVVHRPGFDPFLAGIHRSRPE
jgi:hypothetical protein